MKGSESQSPLRRSAEVSMALAVVFSRGWWLICTKFRTVGWRASGNLRATLWSALGMMLFATATESAILLYGGGGLLIVCEIGHRLFPGSWHSRYIGDSMFGREGRNEYRCRVAEVFLAVVAGGLTLPFDRGCGLWLIAAGIGHSVIIKFLRMKEVHITQDATDARIEAGRYSGG